MCIRDRYWRASYPPEDAAAVALLKSYMEQAGMRVFFDAVGNLHGVLQGKSEQVIMAGSHRDTVRSGGKYDGMLGILSAICSAGRPVSYTHLLAAFFECEEELDYEDIAALFGAVDQAVLAELIDEYFEEITNFVPGSETEVFSIFENVRRADVYKRQAPCKPRTYW